MMLTGKNAIVYGAAGPIGTAVAKAFAAEGATVQLAGRTQESLDRVAAEIRDAGGSAETAIVDALDEASVDEHAAAVGPIDISFNLIGHRQTFGTPLVEMKPDDFELPVATAVRTFYLTSRAAARQMIDAGIRSHPHLRWVRPADGEPGRIPGRLRCGRSAAPEPGLRARTPRHPGAHVADRWHPGGDSGQLRREGQAGSGGGHGRTHDAQAGRDARRCRCRWPSSPPPTSPAR